MAGEAWTEAMAEPAHILKEVSFADTPWFRVSGLGVGVQDSSVVWEYPLRHATVETDDTFRLNATFRFRGTNPTRGARTCGGMRMPASDDITTACTSFASADCPDATVSTSVLDTPARVQDADVKTLCGDEESPLVEMRDEETETPASVPPVKYGRRKVTTPPAVRERLLY